MKSASFNNSKSVKPVTTTQLRLGQQILLTIKRLGINGEGIGHYKGQVVFVPGALPEEVVVVKVIDIQPKHVVGQMLKIKKESPHRKKELCPKALECGGCQLQHMSYASQLKAKKELVVEAFKRYCNIKNPPVKETAGMDNPWGYRNKAQFQVGERDGRLVTGLYSPNSHRLTDLSDCIVQNPLVNKTIQAAKKILNNMGIQPYNERKGIGIIKTLVARAGVKTGEVQLILVTPDRQIPGLDELVHQLRQAIPELVSISQNINPAKTSLVFGDTTIPLWGKEKIREELADLQFLLSPRAFFQLNPEQTKKLYAYVREAAGLTKKETVVDAYCGVGTISLLLARDAKEVRGIEIISEVVNDARENAAFMNITNASFYAGKAEELLPKWVKNGFKPDVIVVDPPRTGLHDKLMNAFCVAKPQKLIYVSCNPATLAKNCSYLLGKGFELQSIQPVDMFPHTSHVESIVLMTNSGQKDK